LTLAEVALGNGFFRTKSRAFQEESAETILAQTTDWILENVFGGRAKAQIYSYLEKKFNLRKSEIAAKPDIFLEGMASLFGSLSCLIERAIVEAVCKGMNLDVRSVFSLADCVAALTKADRERSRKTHESMRTPSSH